jgi:phage terminase small subunit
VARGLSAQEAARSAGYAPGYARKASRLLKSPVIAKAVSEIRSDARREAVYTLLEAVKEIDADGSIKWVPHIAGDKAQ